MSRTETTSKMITFGIETSCDETSCAVLQGRDRIRSNIVSSSLFRHQPFGGIVPEIASRHALEQIDIVYRQALTEAGIREDEIGLVAVTEGPGLIGSLFVGVCFGKTLSYQLGCPLAGVNHLEAHISANFIGSEVPERFIGLLVSGGHTSLLLQESGAVHILGETVDDACGEAYDKVAKLLGLGYPGGPIIDRMAAEGDSKAFSFTRPRQKGRYDFSFSGIKTAVMYQVRREKVLSEEFKRNMAASFQEAVVSWIVDKTVAAAKEHNVRTIVAGGGVSANSYLRKRLRREARDLGIEVLFPPIALTGDNAAMIARRGLELYENGQVSGIRLTGNPNLKINQSL